MAAGAMARPPHFFVVKDYLSISLASRRGKDSIPNQIEISISTS
jgi:hypothetical protein